MKVWCYYVSLFIALYDSSSFESSIECPIPEGFDSITRERCLNFSACRWASNRCIMVDNPESSYSGIPGQDDNTVYFRKSDMSYTMFGKDVELLKVQVIEHEDYHVQIKIVDPTSPRYEVPIELNLRDEPEQTPAYKVDFNTDRFGFHVKRKSSNNVILETIGPLTYEDQFLQITFALKSTDLFGLGENTHLQLRHVFDPRTTYPIWARGQGYTEEPVNLMGQHPLFMVIEDEAGHSHSVMMLNSNPMESSTFLLDDGSPALTLRAIGGIMNFHIFMGPYPEDLNQQYAKMVGFSTMPSYWYLGFQMSRYGYRDSNHVREVMNRNRDAGIPQDVQYCDIDHLDHRRFFTYDPIKWGDMPQLADEMHKDDMHLTIIADPPMVIDWQRYPPAARGKEQDVFVKWASPFLIPSDQPNSCNDYVVGYMWSNNKTVFPDFLNPRTQQWWASEIQRFYKTIPFDSLWIDMNEPINFATDLPRPPNYPRELEDWSLKCPNNKWDSPPYPTMTVRIKDNLSNKLSDSTLCMSSVHSDGTHSYLHYDTHSLYPRSNAEATYKGLQKVNPLKRPNILSRGTYAGQGRYSFHWLGDNKSSWSHLKLSIIGILEFNMFAMPMIGADICGHFNEPSPELCARWLQLGSFYTFSRSHNNEINRDQDPASWGTEIANIAKEALLTRYTLLPYLYTLFHRASTEGKSVLRPLYNVFPSDVQSRNIDDQFLWGNGFMVSPVVEEGAISREIYFPSGMWYEFPSGILVSQGDAKTMDFEAPLEKIPLFIRGGSILPGQQPALRTSISRKNPMKLFVALDRYGTASGELYWDDGDSLYLAKKLQFLSNFTFSQNTLQYTVQQGPDAANLLKFNEILFFGVSNYTNVTLNNEELDMDNITYDEEAQVVRLEIHQNVNEDWTLILD